MHAQLGDADERGDLCASTSLRTALTNLAWLAAGDPQTAKQAAEEGTRMWSRRGFHLQHHWSLLSRTQVDLYAGRSEDAAARVASSWGAFRSSRLGRIQVVYAEMLYLRARASLACAHGPRRATELRRAAQDAARLDRLRSPHTSAFAGLVRAGVAARQGRIATAASELAVAATRLDAAGMLLFARAADRWRGQLTHDGAGPCRGRVDDIAGDR
jgi:hypothetical protein